MWPPNRENLRIAKTTNTFELLQVRKVTRKCLAHALEDARSIVKCQRYKYILVQSQLIDPDGLASEDNLIIERERNRAFVPDAECYLDSLQDVARINLHRLVLSISDG